MDKKLRKLFQDIPDIEPPLTLEASISKRISQERAIYTRRRTVWSNAALAVSIVLAVYTTWSFGSSLLRSDFWSVASLIFSDWKTVANYWNDFLYSLLETLPVITLVMIIAPLFIFFWSLSSYMNLPGKNRHKYLIS